VAQAFWAAIGCIGYPRLEHDTIHDLSDPHTADPPYRRTGQKVGTLFGAFLPRGQRNIGTAILLLAASSRTSEKTRPRFLTVFTDDAELTTISISALYFVVFA
jgi:hypothetical protein